MKEAIRQLRLEGFPVSGGIAIGRLYFLLEEEEKRFPVFSINTDEVDREIQRYRLALSSSRKDLEQLQGYLSEEALKRQLQLSTLTFRC